MPPYTYNSPSPEKSVSFEHNGIAFRLQVVQDAAYYAAHSIMVSNPERFAPQAVQASAVVEPIPSINPAPELTESALSLGISNEQVDKTFQAMMQNPAVGVEPIPQTHLEAARIETNAASIETTRAQFDEQIRKELN